FAWACAFFFISLDIELNCPVSVPLKAIGPSWVPVSLQAATVARRTIPAIPWQHRHMVVSPQEIEAQISERNVSEGPSCRDGRRSIDREAGGFYPGPAGANRPAQSARGRDRPPPWAYRRPSRGPETDVGHTSASPTVAFRR